MSQDLSVKVENALPSPISCDEIVSAVRVVTWAIALPCCEFIHLSSAIEHLSGHLAQTLLDERWCWDTLIHPADVAALKHQFSSLRSGDRLTFKCRIVCADDQIQPVMGHATLVGATGANGARIQGVMLADTAEPEPKYRSLPPQADGESHSETHHQDDRFRAIFEQTSVGVVQFDSDGRYQLVNPRFCEMVGYTADELLQMTVADLTHPDDRATDLDGDSPQSQDHNAVPDEFTHEKRYLCKNGQVLWVRCVGSVLQDLDRRHRSTQSNAHPNFMAIVWDIGDRKQAEQSLRQSQQMLRLVIDNIPQRIFWKDTNLVYLGCNQRQAEWAGLSSPNEIVGKTDYDLPWSISDSDAYRVRDQRVIEAKHAEYYVSQIERQANGQAVLLEVSKIPLRNSEGQVIGVLGTIDDITDRKRVEAALVQKTAELQAVFAAFPDLFFRIASDGTYLDCKVQNLNDLLFSPDQLLGKRIQDVLPHPIGKGMWQGIQVTLRTQSLTVLEHSLELPQGRQYFEARIVPYQDNEVLVLVRNLTQRKQAEQALIRSEKRFQRLAENLPGTIYQYLQPSHSEPGQFLYLSPSLRRLYELSPRQVLAESRSMGDMVNSEDWPYVQASLQKATASLTPWRSEWRIQTAVKGEQRWVQSIAKPERQTDGSVLWDGILLDITERKRFETVLRVQAQREQALNQVIQAIRDSLDLSTIFSKAASQTAKLLDAVRVCILRHVPARQTWQFVMDYSLHDHETNLVGSEIQDSDRHLFTRLKQGDSLRMTDQQLCRTMSESCRQIVAEVPGHWLIVPLMVSGESTSEMPVGSRIVQIPQPPYVWGCLCLVSPHPQTRWQDSDYALTQVIANQLAIAIQQSELYHRIRLFNVELEHQVQQRTVELEYALSVEALLKRIIDNVRDSLDEDQILQTVVRELATTLVLDSCNTGLYDLDAQVVHIRQEHITIDIPNLQGYVEPLSSRPEMYPQLLAGQMVYFSHLESDPLRPGYKPTVLCCPIVSEGLVIGDLWLYRPQYAAFSPIEIRLIEKVVSQCAIAMRQARLYRAAQVQVQELERLSQLKDDFLCTVSHELRTPIASVHMATQMLEMHLSQDELGDVQSKSIAQCLKLLRDGAEQEMALINDLLDLQHLRAGTHPLDIDDIDIQSWLPHLMDGLDFQTHARDRTLHLTLPETLPTISSDRAGLQRVLVELLNNALKYTPSGETIALVATATEHHIQFEIRNTGVEIPVSELPYIFDQFYRVPQADRWQHGGIGLGLALVQEWVTHLQGEISVQSDRNETRFILKLPIQHPSHATAHPMQ